MYYSSQYLREFHRRARVAAQTITDDYEIMFVNDGSPDNSIELARSLYEDDPHTRIIDLSRNFGHHKAMMTGLAYAHGDLVFLIDSDLEESPELLSDFLAKMEETEADVVYGVQDVRNRGWFDNLSSRIFYTVFNWLSDYPIPHDLLTIRLMTNRYIQQLVKHQEQVYIIAGIWERTGFKQVAYPVHKKFKGTSSYNFRKQLSYAVYATVVFSRRPLVYISYLGLLITVPSALFILWNIIKYFTGGIGLDGFTTLIVSIWFLSGLIIFILGIIALYLSVIFLETKKRPNTIVRAIYSHESESDSEDEP